MNYPSVVMARFIFPLLPTTDFPFGAMINLSYMPAAGLLTEDKVRRLSLYPDVALSSSWHLHVQKLSATNIHIYTNHEQQ